MFRRGVGVFNGKICSVLRIAVPGSVFLGIEPQLALGAQPARAKW